MTDLLELLRDENPVVLEDVDVPAGLRPTDMAVVAPRRWRGVRVGPALRAGIVIAAAAVVLLMLGGGRPGLSLAARVVVIGGGREIVHWRAELHNYVNGRDQEHTRVEGWSRLGVTHVVFSKIERGRTRLLSDSRTAGGRTRIYSASSDDYATVPAPSRPNSSPLAFREAPLAIFRRAYHAGTLRKLGPHRYAVSLGPHDSDKAIYDIDPATARPLSLTVHSHSSDGPRRYDIRFVVRFAAYERLAFNASTRTRLQLLAHAGAGPKNDPAADHFAVLRHGGSPAAAQLRLVHRFASHSNHDRLDPNETRVLQHGLFLIPGNGDVCLVVERASGIGGQCDSVAHAVKHGLATGGVPPPGGTHRSPLTVVVPDGVRALRARIRGNKTATVSVHDNIATLPGETYAWTFLK